MRRVLLPLVLMMALASGCTYAAETLTHPYQAPDERLEGADRGELLYLQDCAWCHGDGGEGTGRGPDLLRDTNGKALTHFMLSTGRMPLRYPRERVTRRDPRYPPDDIDALVAHVATFGGQGPDIPHVDVASGDLAQGQQLYAENCAACHGVMGVGGALAADDPVTAQIGSRAPPIAGTPQEIAEAILTGPSTMPVFDETMFTDQELDSLVRYARYIQDPSQRGGWAIGFVGPVGEGFVTWVIGLALLIALIRWIGESKKEEE